MDGAPVSSIRIAMKQGLDCGARAQADQGDRRKGQASGKGPRHCLLWRSKYVGWGGGIPVWKNGEVVGAVAVSGLSSNEDIALAALVWN